MRSIYYTRFIDGGGGRVVLEQPFLSVKIKKGRQSRLIVKGELKFTRWLDGQTRTLLDISDDAALEFHGDFTVGNGVKIVAQRGARIVFAGRLGESASGITADSIFLIRKSLNVGRDFICAWGVFVTDCDWHNFNDHPSQRDVFIGDKVWIAHHASVLKGATVPSGCVIAAHAVVNGSVQIQEASLLAGVPATIKRSDIRWSREMQS